MTIDDCINRGRRFIVTLCHLLLPSVSQYFVTLCIPSPREDDEKLNVYMAWFNLEIASGEEEKADAVFSDAIKFNDEYQVYLQVRNKKE